MFGLFLRKNIQSLKVFRSVCTANPLKTSAAYSTLSELQKHLKKMKLSRFQCLEKNTQSKPCVEVLKNIHEDLDLVHVRSRQPQVLYLRTELLLQRIGFLEPIGITSRQKRKHIERNPPVLVFDYEPSRDEGCKVAYVRGIVRHTTNSEDKFTHVLHPCSPLIVMRSFDLRKRVEFIQEQLGMAQSTVLRFILNIPAFLLHNRQSMSENFHLIHKHVLPQGFDLDCHTAELYPPVYLSNHGIPVSIHSKAASENMASSLPVLGLSDVLDYSYKENHWKGRPEDLVEFLIHAEKRELRPRYNKLM